MQLTTLEIKGFKSFADKTTIHFNNNITGIVGPNGCGKSNVVDSIRWVLGEQKTSHLRLEKMENLIFNGTKNRKAAGLAEVSLTFENTKNVLSSDYKTVTITRRLFRDGESEYRLNDVPCRLRDITGLFLDTGISPDSYAIIELGMMDEILNDRDNSRRKLFEQAAGISKFKKRKKDTIDKLKSTDQDLERVKDLLFEIENNLKTLEKQAQKTQKYYELKEEYKKLSLLLARHALQEYKTSFTELETKKQISEDKKLEIETAIATAEAALEKEKLDNVEKERALAEVQKKLNSLVSVVAEKENERNLLNSQMKFALDKMDSAQRQIIDASEHIEKLTTAIAQLKIDEGSEQTKLTEKKNELEALQAILDEIRSKHNLSKDALSQEQKAFSDQEKMIFELEKNLAVNRSNRESLQKDLFSSDEDAVSKDLEKVNLENKILEISQQKELSDQQLQRLIQQEEENRVQITELESAIEKTRQELTQETRTLDARKNEYELTKSLVENLEGFPESIKFLKKNNKWSSQAQLLSDIIYCPEDYRVAIENFLDQYLNYYVVKSWEEAKMAVSLLHDSSMGRANFFILDEIEKYESQEPFTLEGLTPASEIVEVDGSFKKLIAYLLDRVYIVHENHEPTGAEIDSWGKKVVLLSKNGRFVRRDFTLSGGSIGLFEGKKIGRAKNLDKLKNEIEQGEKSAYKLHQQVANAQIKINQLKTASVMRDIDLQRNQSGKLSNELASAKGSLESMLRFIENSQAKSKSISERIENLKNEIESAQNRLTELKSKQEEGRLRLEKSDKDFARYSQELSEAGNQYNQKNIEFLQQQNRMNSIVQELTFKESQSDSLQKQVSRNQEVIEECRITTDGAQRKLKEIEGNLLSGYSDKDAYTKEVSDVEKRYYDSRTSIQEMDTRLRELMKNRENALAEIAENQNRFNELRLQLTSMKERLSVEFQADINVLLNEPADETLVREELEEDVAKIKKRIENYGEINPMALEAFQEMKTRYEFIITQKTDLEDAKNSLLNTIQEIEDTARGQFMEAFTKVRESFIRVFRTLFTEEDQCDLILQNPDDPLESKIDIVAKPKGKRPTVIDQLSGGEKTLTATALLFSLYLLKPAPFCVFDEVDAPLDDNNIAKFNKIIQEFSKDSQFIIVTHNKQTMTSVDAIYGVTMAEQGVSRVVPVSFASLN